MATATERPHLRELRLEQGWTQQDVADRMARLVWSRRDKPVGVTADMVAKWERGAKGVSPRYRALLAGVFKVTVDQLGLPGAARGQSARRDDQSLVAVVDQAADLLQQLDDAGRGVRPQVLAALTDDVLSRRSMLHVLDGSRPPAGPPDPAELDALTDRYHAAHGTTAPAVLMTALTAHLRMGADALVADLSTGTRQRLLRNRARTAILAGQLAAEDLDQPMAARGYLAQALDDAHELDDHSIAALAHGHAARVALADGQPAAALHHIHTAAQLKVTDPARAAWLAGIETDAHAAQHRPCTVEPTRAAASAR